MQATDSQFTKGQFVTVTMRDESERDGEIVSGPHSSGTPSCFYVVEVELETRHEKAWVREDRISLNAANEFENYMAVRETED